MEFFAKGLLEPLDYIHAVAAIIEYATAPVRLLEELVLIFITTPTEAAEIVLIGLAIMTILWFCGSVKS